MSGGKLPYDTEHYAGEEVEEYVGIPVPTFLKWVYLILPIWGLFWFWMYWDGSTGALDRGSWQDLAQAAKTTFSSQK